MRFILSKLALLRGVNSSCVTLEVTKSIIRFSSERLLIFLRCEISRKIRTLDYLLLNIKDWYDISYNLNFIWSYFSTSVNSGNSDSTSNKLALKSWEFSSKSKSLIEFTWSGLKTTASLNEFYWKSFTSS